jgi:hypothetical protein
MSAMPGVRILQIILEKYIRREEDLRTEDRAPSPLTPILSFFLAIKPKYKM